jgi:Rho-associated protein kinase 1
MCLLHYHTTLIPILQEKNNLEIDLNYKLKSLQQRLEQEVNEHKVTKARLTDKHQSIEEAKSVAMCGKCQL